jgi:hypothetical protein
MAGTPNRGEFSLIIQCLARIAHAVEALAKAANPDFKPLPEENATKPTPQYRRL